MKFVNEVDEKNTKKSPQYLETGLREEGTKRAYTQKKAARQHPYPAPDRRAG